MLPHEVFLAIPIHPRHVDRTLGFDETDHLTDRVLGRNRDQHVHMVRHQMPFFNLALLLLGQTPEYLAQVRPETPVQRLAAALGYENDMLLALPLRVA